MDRWQPTPLLEGGALDRQVLGTQTWPQRPQILLGKPLPNAKYEIMCGSLMGLRAQSVLAVYPPRRPACFPDAAPRSSLLTTATCI